MKEDEFISMLHKTSFIDCLGSGATSEQLNDFAIKFQSSFGVAADSSWTSLLSKVNGFDNNGLVFYGTSASKEQYVLGFFEQNQFWRTELPGLMPYVLLADGDSDFFVQDIRMGTYHLLDKGDLSKVLEFEVFEKLLAKIADSYF